MANDQKLDVFALDFDGVLCDSAVECAHAAWRAGSRLWKDWRGHSPSWLLVRRFVKLRPVVETGYQCILLMRLIKEQYDDKEIYFDFSELSRALLDRIGLTREQFIERFEEARDQWLRDDEHDWLHHHQFYEGVFDTFIERMFRMPVFILTTKPERYVLRLLENQGIYFPARHLYGLDSGKTKEMVLRDLIARPEYENACFHFVEDRLATLLRVAASPELEKVHLYLARWGYNTEQDRQYAAKLDRITIWDTEDFLNVSGRCSEQPDLLPMKE